MSMISAMTNQEFESRLKQLYDVITTGLWCNQVWESLFFHDPSDELSLDELQEVLNWYRGAFTPIQVALQQTTLLQFAKVFDSDSRTCSLRVLLGIIRRSPELVPHSSPEEIRQLRREINSSEELLRRLERHRNTRLAHIDADPVTDSILKQELDELIEKIINAYNVISQGHDRTRVAWNMSLDDSTRDSKKLLSSLRDQMTERKRKLEERYQRTRS